MEISELEKGADSDSVAIEFFLDPDWYYGMRGGFGYATVVEIPRPPLREDEEACEDIMYVRKTYAITNARFKEVNAKLMAVRGVAKKGLRHLDSPTKCYEVMDKIFSCIKPPLSKEEKIAAAEVMADILYTRDPLFEHDTIDAFRYAWTVMTGEIMQWEYLAKREGDVVTILTPPSPYT